MSYVITVDCDGCGNCADACAIGAIARGEKIYVIDQELCVECGACSYLCDKSAIMMSEAYYATT